jgi:hypothetical protein
MGKGKDANAEALDHQSTPLSTLKDPASFGPPPKRNLAAAPDSSTLGAPVPTPTRAQRQAEREAEEEANKPSPGPYRVNTTGIDLSTLPKPPARRPGQLEAPSPPPSRGTTSAPKAKPKLPPRLPPRQNSHPDTHAEVPPPTYNESTQESGPAQGYLNQSALDRLAKSGVSVPGFGIGRTASPPVPPRQNTASPTKPAFAPPPEAGHGPQLSELQSRFSKMAKPSAEAQSGEQATPGRRTASTLAQKYGVANVGQGSASTATPSQAANGLETASGLAQKYGMANKATPIAPPLQSPTYGGSGKKPPPPPPKKKELVANSTGEPPPIPMGSKPKF